jgi:hypothetical protein
MMIAAARSSCVPVPFFCHVLLRLWLYGVDLVGLSCKIVREEDEAVFIAPPQTDYLELP